MILFGITMVAVGSLLAFKAVRAARAGRTSLFGEVLDFDRLSSPEEFWFVVVFDAIVALTSFIIGVLALTVW